MTAISGNTYPVKDQIKALGGKWNPDSKAWMVPDAQADAARKLVASGAASQPQKSTYHPRTCVACGCRSEFVTRRGWAGYEPKILRSGECVDCYEERKMGY